MLGTQTQMSAGALVMRLEWLGCLKEKQNLYGNVYYSITLISIYSSVFTAHSKTLPPFLLSLFFPFTCCAPTPPHPSRSPSPLQATEKEKESPVELTERCFRELLGRAAYGNIKNAVTPVLMWVTCVKTVDLLLMRRLNLWTIQGFVDVLWSLHPLTQGGLWQGQCKVDVSD